MAGEAKKYFVISDVHSFYTEMKEALDEAGYDRNNENHILISLGDVFDRGDETLKMLKFLKSIPKERRILVRGNHELLLRDCYEGGVFYVNDEKNGTARTMCHLCGFDPDFKDEAYANLILAQDKKAAQEEYNRLWNEYLTKPFKSKKIKNVIDWIKSDEWVNYFELGKYVFVHSWVPVETTQDEYFIEHERPIEDWRNATDKQWEDAMWGCPWRHFLAGSVPEGKTIVCGHWHVQDFHMHLGHEVDGYKNREIYYSDRLIALDAMTARSPHMCNVLIIDGDRCYDKHQRALN